MNFDYESKQNQFSSTKTSSTTTATTAKSTRNSTTRDDGKSSTSDEIKIYDQIIKSKNDQRNYRGVQLKNGLKIMLVSDPKTNKSAASLCVNVGSMQDPIELQGLSHFLEHMLFLGTEKYPNSNEYDHFLKQHGGSGNAYTSSDHTVFHFDIATDYLEPALDRFVQFFISPLFDPVYTDKELNAIHSEYEKYLDTDRGLFFYVDKETCDQGHDYHKFNIGNKKTLKELPKANGINVREELLKFYSTNYSSNIMKLCVLGKESLDDLFEMVINRLPFGEIENKNVSVKIYDSQYKDEQLQKMIKIVPIKDIRALSIAFRIPDYNEKNYRTRAGHYVSHLIGHEGKGSILSELKINKGLVSSLNSGTDRCAIGCDIFHIEMSLTTQGLDQIEEIIKVIFQYLNMLRREGAKKWIYDECSALKKIQFDYQEKSRPFCYVTGISNRMIDYSINEVIKGSHIMDDYQPELIDDLISYLKPENMRVFVIAKKFVNQPNLRKEQHYGINYSYEDIPDDMIQLWKNSGYNSNLHLPTPNEFIPNKLELVERDELITDNPILYKKDNYSHIWYKQDNEYKVPRAFYGIQIKSSALCLDPVNILSMNIYTQLLIDHLNEYSYSAHLAGLNYLILNKDAQGLIIEVSGYSEKLYVILTKIVDQLMNFEFDRKRFDTIKECCDRGLKNFQLQSLSALLDYHYLLFSNEKSFNDEDYLQAIDHVTFEEVERVARDFFSKLFFDIFVYGNVTKDDVDRVEKIVKDALIENYNSRTVHKSCLLPKRHLKLDNNSFYIFQKRSDQHQNNAILNYYQFKQESTVDNVKIELLAKLLSNKFYNNLRTEEQLGYLVKMGIKYHLGVQGMCFLIQSTYKVQYLDDRIDNFLRWAKDYLDDLTDQEFQTYKDGLKVLKSESPKTLLSRSRVYWSEIALNYYNFDRRIIELEALKVITKQDIIDTFDEYFVIRRRKLSIRISGEKKNINSSTAQDDKEDVKETIDELPKDSKLIENLLEFQSQLEAFPLIQPFIKIN